MQEREPALVRKQKTSTMIENRKDGVLYFTFLSLTGLEGIVHGFSSRIGGVSTGMFSSMNLGFARGDREERVRENFRRIAAAMGFEADRIVCSDQTHTTNVRVATEADAGKGLLRPKDYTDVDALVTDVPGLVLATFYADCVPLYFVDPARRAIGLAHSGWKGTVNNIAAATLASMRENYGTDPANVLAAVGPSICQDCYEVSEDVIGQFRERYPRELWPSLFYAKENGKYQLNLWEACRANLTGAGVLPQHIEITDVCTCCNPGLLFSHRASHGRRGNLGAFLGLLPL